MHQVQDRVCILEPFSFQAIVIFFYFRVRVQRITRKKVCLFYSIKFPPQVVQGLKIYSFRFDNYISHPTFADQSTLMNFNVSFVIVQMSNFSNIDEKSKYQLECLEYQLGIISPIRPLNGFSLDFNTVLAAVGLMTTYTIVLLQFKMDENK